MYANSACRGPASAHTTRVWQRVKPATPSVDPGVQRCDFCAGDFFSQGNDLSATTQRYNQVWLEGDAQPLVIDEEGRRLGYDEGKFVNEIPGAKVQRVLGDNSLAQQDVPPIFHIPDSNLEIGLDAGGDGTIDEVVNMADQE